MLLNDGKLGLSYQGEWVSIKKCFPKTHPTRFLAVLDKDGKEVRFIDDLVNLSEEERVVIENYFLRSNYRVVITAIQSVEEEFGFRHWEVETTSGKRSFQTALHAWPKKFADGSILVEDLNSDRYWIDESSSLSKDSKKILSIYVD